MGLNSRWPFSRRTKTLVPVWSNLWATLHTNYTHWPNIYVPVQTTVNWDGNNLVCVQRGEKEGRGWTHWLEGDKLHLVRMWKEKEKREKGNGQGKRCHDRYANWGENMQIRQSLEVTHCLIQLHCAVFVGRGTLWKGLWSRGGGGERKEGEHKRGGRLLNARLNKALQELWIRGEV